MLGRKTERARAHALSHVKGKGCAHLLEPSARLSKSLLRRRRRQSRTSPSAHIAADGNHLTCAI
eukprot:693724-Rhodomonas_salina.3